MKLTCIIIDDEPLARQLLQYFVAQTNGVKLLGSYDNADALIQNIEALKDELDVVFLDLQMRMQTGVEVIEQINWSQIRVIVTSAYPEKIVESLNMPYFDWLQKPIQYEVFVEALQKVWEDKNQSH